MFAKRPVSQDRAGHPPLRFGFFRDREALLPQAIETGRSLLPKAIETRGSPTEGNRDQGLSYRRQSRPGALLPKAIETRGSPTDDVLKLHASPTTEVNPVNKG